MLLPERRGRTEQTTADLHHVFETLLLLSEGLSYLEPQWLALAQEPK